VDFSEHSDMALRSAAFLSSSQQAKLILMHVIEHLHASEYFMTLILSPQQIKARLEDEANRHVSLLPKTVNCPTNVETEIREGKAFVEIVKKAKEDDVDLIVIGSHGRTGLPHIMIGSVAEKVARKAPCHVLIVKAKGARFEMP
jgi:universal stress protein A